MPVILKYRIPRNLTTSIARQVTAFSSPALVLPAPGELDYLQMDITADAVVIGATYLERNITLTERVPGFVDTFGASENASQWHLETLWGERIEKALSTRLLPVP